MFAIGWQYLVGRAVATDVTDRHAPEWPPHPDRLFQALVAAWGERGEDAEERTALLWLEAQPPPQLEVPPAEPCATPKVYVPVNDTSGKRGEYETKQLALLPAKRSRKERYFPGMSVGEGRVVCIWEDADAGKHLPALRQLASAVTYVGHSSSLVRASCLDDATKTTRTPSIRPADRGEPVHHQLRVPTPGRLAYLKQCFAGGGKDWQRPGPGAWRAYTTCDTSPVIRGEFGHRMQVLRRVGGAPWSLPQALDIAKALRATLLPHLDGRALALFSGHASDGTPLREPHVAYLPMAFAGHRHADGHLLGVALGLPADADYADEEAFFDALADMMDPDTDTFALRLPGGRETWVALETRAAPALALRSETWCAVSRVWDSVTPVALDRHPPRRHPDPDGFVAERIQVALSRQGLPGADDIRISPVSALEGVPPVSAFPSIDSAGARRRQVHVRLVLSAAVGGPLVLGAGRYRGYGLFKPSMQEGSR